MANHHRAKLQEFTDILDKEVIDLKKLKKCVFQGCPDEAHFRSKCWKILLFYLPTNRVEWDKVLKKQRALYIQFIDEMVIKPGTEVSENDGMADVTFADHPLNPNPDSKWIAYFKDNEMLLQIDKDCRRLCPDLNFFQCATEFPCSKLCGKNHFDTLRKRVEQTVLQSESVSRNRLGITNMSNNRRKYNDGYTLLPDGQEAHWEVCERILFVYAKLNPGLAYIQGMNEILGPIYYTFASDPDRDCRENAEADSFFCFTNLMSEIRDNFIKTLDYSQCGIGNLMDQLLKLLLEKDATLYHKLQEQDLKPQFYAFRWLTLLLSQEFPLPDVLRIWDSLFADEKRFSFLIKIACAMLVLLKDELLAGDFANNMKLVQNFPTIDIQLVINKAVEISRSVHKFAVVEFISENEVGIVPVKWLNVAKTICFWPSWKSMSKIQMAVKMCVAANDVFKQLAVRVLFETGDYDKARKKLKLSEETSDLQTEAEEDVPLKKKIIPNTRYDSSDDEIVPRKDSTY